jgi:hypothetical protein
MVESKAQEPDQGGQMTMATTHRQPSEPKPADVLVVFGISSDLANVTTFRSLWRGAWVTP